MIPQRDTLVRHCLMHKLLETIKIKDGKVYHLSYHQYRCDYSLKYYGKDIKYNLKQMINPPKQGMFRCRIVYDDSSVKIDYYPYKKTAISSLKLIESNIEYPLKFEDRHELNELYDQKEEADDIIIVKNDLITDTTRANIALFDGNRWLTPTSPLLYGTTRQRLIEKKLITPCKIHVNELDRFTKIAVMNALVGFHIVKNGIIKDKN